MATEELIITTEKSVKNVDRLNTSIKKGTKASKEHGRAMLDSAKDVSFMGVSMRSLQAGFKAGLGGLRAMVLGLKSFKVALAATGIGLIVIALVSLIAVFKSSQEGTDKLNKVMNIIKFTIDALIKSAISLGKALLMIASGNVINGFKALAKTIGEVGDMVRENIKMAGEFSDRQIEIMEHTIALTTQQAEYNRTIAESRTILADTNELLVDRLAAGELALQASEELAEKQKENLELQILNLEIGLKASTTLRADRLEIAQLEAQVINAETQQARTRMRLITQIRTVEKKAFEEAHKEKMAFAKIELANEVVMAKRGLAIVQGTAIAEISMEKAHATISSAIQSKLSLQAKQSSIGQAFINIKEAITAALKHGPFALIEIPLILASGLATIASMVSIFVHPPFKFGRGGLIQGPSHAQGGVRASIGNRDIEFEGGEAVINKRSTSMFKDQLSYMNQAGGGVKFQQGGMLPRGIADAGVPSAPIAVPILVTDDLHTVENRIKVTEERATL